MYAHHYSDVIRSAMEYQIIDVSVVWSIVCSGKENIEDYGVGRQLVVRSAITREGFQALSWECMEGIDTIKHDVVSVLKSGYVLVS